jgi:two-component system LytT family response regulator
MRVLVVDDERLARVGIRRALDRLPGVEIVGECSDGEAAVEAIVADRPDLVLLDVQMPGLSGFGVVERIGVEAMPLVIFVTAHDRHAVQAFEVHAADYLLKPVDPARLADAVDRAAKVLARDRVAETADRLEAMLRRVAPPEGLPGSAPLERIVVRERERMFFVDTAAIDWAEGAGNYIKLHVEARDHLIRSTMDRLAVRLGPERFVRIRRSALVNVQAIRSLEPYGKGSYTLILRSGERLVSSRYFVRELNALLRRGI